MDDLHIFSDGSGIEGNIGAVAIALPTHDQLPHQLGTDDEDTVFEALNSFLKKCKASQMALCPHCKKPETITHYLLHCRKYHLQQHILKAKAGKVANSVPRLLNDPKNPHCTLCYIAAMRRFRNYTDVAIDDDHK
ncbi:hypothetical protein M422DRAFT_262686 [Sphaerobolus stellatus SS14]|uniref:Uncharacterized protein n=1 Tax=Sphaerobolus stellatus (strain SS14) TaxID=990650 RepID=A0A0C9VCP3_SPHS4|nr:hypothetical protein M422DRAFT_262686 [Sphaerobolus stellatus SS14]